MKCRPPTLIEMICNRCIYKAERDCFKNTCSLKEEIEEMLEKIEKLEKENKSLASKAKFWESEANYDKYEEYV